MGLLRRLLTGTDDGVEKSKAMLRTYLDQQRTDREALLRVVRAVEKIYETTGDGYMFKHILVEGEGDKWHIPETMGLALAEALKALPEHLRGE